MQNQRTEILTRDRKKDIPDGIWLKCNECGETIYNGELSRNLRICPKCNYYFPLEPSERIALLADEKSFLRHDPADAVICPDEGSYAQTIITGEAALSRHRLVIVAVNIGVTDEAIGLFVCERIIKAVAHAVDRRLPLLLVCANNAETQNGAFCPAQTLSTSAALSRMVKEKLLYISVLANSNSHGDFPGFAYLADIVAVESNTPNVLRADNQNSQNGSVQAARALLQNGMVDLVVSRRELRQTLTDILNFFC
jgi:acetyl-CoA carboxylase carboxyl transferase subunit beta